MADTVIESFPKGASVMALPTWIDGSEGVKVNIWGQSDDLEFTLNRDQADALQWQLGNALEQIEEDE